VVKILIVEDDFDLCETYTDVLENEGHDLVAISTCTQAIECLIRNRMKPDVVILDLNLSGESGLIVLGLIRRLPKLINTKVIIASGYPDLAKRAIEQWGADLFLPKPVAIDVLKNTVRGLGPSGAN
jgi:two-component system phosphoglycerate transport system response regulator PgtA